MHDVKLLDSTGDYTISLSMVRRGNIVTDVAVVETCRVSDIPDLYSLLGDHYPPNKYYWMVTGDNDLAIHINDDPVLTKIQGYRIGFIWLSQYDVDRGTSYYWGVRGLPSLKCQTHSRKKSDELIESYKDVALIPPDRIKKSNGVINRVMFGKTLLEMGRYLQRFDGRYFVAYSFPKVSLNYIPKTKVFESTAQLLRCGTNGDLL